MPGASSTHPSPVSSVSWPHLPATGPWLPSSLCSLLQSCALAYRQRSQANGWKRCVACQLCACCIGARRPLTSVQAGGPTHGGSHLRAVLGWWVRARGCRCGYAQPPAALPRLWRLRWMRAGIRVRAVSVALRRTRTQLTRCCMHGRYVSPVSTLIRYATRPAPIAG